jgi:CHASE2 domain-containing sensor protein
MGDGEAPSAAGSTRWGAVRGAATSAASRVRRSLERAAAWSKSRAQRAFRGKGAHDFRYWLFALAVIGAATFGSSYVYERLNLTDARSSFFQRLLDWRQPAEPKFVRLVLIENDEYWLGELAGRRPIKRDYLARLVDKLVAANAHVIALDFDVRLPDPRSMEIPQDYRAETLTLIHSIENAARQGKKVVLATPISLDREGRYHRDSDIYQAHDLCRPGSTDEVRKNITCGYIALPRDRLVLPARQTMADGSSLDSFALAVARAWEPELIDRMLKRIGSNVRYGSFISDETFTNSGARLSARAVLDGSVGNKLASKTVIVGAHWSRDAAGRGPRIDLHWTPVGNMVGAMLHANFAESLVDSRIFGATPEWVLRVIEIAFSLFAALVFALIPRFSGKLISILPVLVLLFLAQWAVLHGFGIFFDIFVPLVGLALHGLIERLFAPREHGSEARRAAS